MRVTVVSHPSVVRANQRAYRALRERGHDVELVVPDRWRHAYAAHPFDAEVDEGLRGHVHRLRVLRPGSVHLHVYRVRCRAVLRRLRPDVVYVEEESYSLPAQQWATTARAAGVPFLFYSAQNMAKRYPLLVRLAERRVWRRAAGAVAVTGRVEAALRERGFSGRTFEVPLVVDADALRAAPELAGGPQGLGLRARVVGFVGRVVADKGVDDLLQAYARLARRDTTSLLVVGNGDLADRCAREDGVVVVPGVPHGRIGAYLALMDVLAVPSRTTPSWTEQFGRVVVEAMAAGVPVVASDSGEPKHLLSQGGGVVVPERHPKALADALDLLLRDPQARSAVGAVGRRRAEAFRPETVAQRLEYALAAAAGTVG